MSRSSSSAPSHFEPAVTVSALALNNLNRLPYYRLRLSPTPSHTSPVAKRAKWLEHGVGSHTAFHAAALAELAENLPAVLAVSLPPHQSAHQAHSSPPKPPRRPVSSSSTVTACATASNSTSITNATSAPTSAPAPSSSSAASGTAAPTAAQHPSLWLFAPTHVLRHANDILASDFTIVDRSVWTANSSTCGANPPNCTTTNSSDNINNNNNSSPTIVTKALTLALRRAIATALYSENAIRVADDIIHPQTNLAYTFNIGVGHGPDPNILIRVSARNYPVRFIDDDDCTAALISSRPPLAVFTAPLGLRGVLTPRPCAGDALSLSVLKRWREAGMLPPKLTDTTVVFIKLDDGDGVEVPFPRACVLTMQHKPSRPTISKPTLDDLEAADLSAAKKPWRTNVALWKSRKRPRSPVSPPSSNDNDLTAFAATTASTSVAGAIHNEDEDEDDDVNLNTNLNNNNNTTVSDIVPDFPDVDEELLANNDDAPTADSLAAAMQQAISKDADVANDEESDVKLKLNHPLIEPIPQLTFHDAPDNEPTPPEFGSANRGQDNHPTIPPHEQQPQQSQRPPPPAPKIESSTITNVKAETTAAPSNQMPEQSSNGLDAFLISNPQESVGPLESSGAVDMSDFGAFDDDVTVFFPNDMDDRSHPESSLLQPDDTPRTPGFPQPDPSLIMDVDSSTNPNASTTLLPSALPPQNPISTNTNHAAMVEPVVEKKEEVVVIPSNSRPDEQRQQQPQRTDEQAPDGNDGTKESNNDENAIENANSTANNLNVLDFTLASLRRAVPSVQQRRPEHKVVKAKLSSIYEEDVLRRRTAKLKARHAIYKRGRHTNHRATTSFGNSANRFRRDVFITKAALSSPSSGALRQMAISRNSQTSVILENNNTGSATTTLSSSPKHLGPTAEQRFSDQLRGMYVPRRPMQKYIKLRRRGINVSLSILKNGTYESDESDDENNVPQDDRQAKQMATNNQNKAMSNVPLIGHPPRLSHVQSMLANRNSRLQGNNSNKSAHHMQTTSANTANFNSALCVDYDPAKIVDSVAVDCASVCMVLAAERSSYSASTFTTATEFQQSPSSVMPFSATDLDNNSNMMTKLMLPSVPQGSSSSAPSSSSARAAVIPSVLGKPSVPASSLPTGAATSAAMRTKKEREFLSLLSLIEMQIFGLSELGLFDNCSELPKTDGSQSRVADNKSPQCSNTSQSPDSDKVSHATMRRLLLGLTRTLEMSDTFKTWIDAFRESSDNNQLIPSVHGPLSVNAFFGRSASAFPLPPPRVCVGYDNDLIETSAAALPLWEKAGMEPYGDMKNVEYVTLGPKDIEEDVKNFVRDLSTTYEECLFGRHVPVPDAFMCIANSMSKPPAPPKHKPSAALLDSERAMADQYHLSTTALISKLSALVKERRKNPSGRPTNLVAYIISPFDRCRVAANVALLHAVAPLVGTIPGTVPSLPFVHANAHHHPTGIASLNLPVAPWRASPSSKSTVSVTVRLIPREIVDRRFGGIDVESLLNRPARPQLMKAISFAVFSSIRYKRVRNPPHDELATGLDLMSPMTPDVLVDPAGTPQPGQGPSPLSPMGVSSTTSMQPTTDDSVAAAASATNNNNNTPSTASAVTGAPSSSSMAPMVSPHIDHGMVTALSPSYLHDAAIVLAGVGRHLGETGDKANMVLHLGYVFCEAMSRIVFAWTDQRGELLDTAAIPVTSRAARRRAFCGMWARANRWRLPYVDDVHATVCKLGLISRDELDDWDWVMNKLVCSSYGGSEHRKNADGSDRRVARRFPPIYAHGADADPVDGYLDVPTPATPGVVTHPSPPVLPGLSRGGGTGGVGAGSGAGGGIGSGVGASSSAAAAAQSMDVKLPGIASVSILAAFEADTSLLMEKPGDIDVPTRPSSAASSAAAAAASSAAAAAAHPLYSPDRTDFAVVSDVSLTRVMAAATATTYQGPYHASLHHNSNNNAMANTSAAAGAAVAQGAGGNSAHAAASAAAAAAAQQQQQQPHQLPPPPPPSSSSFAAAAAAAAAGSTPAGTTPTAMQGQHPQQGQQQQQQQAQQQQQTQQQQTQQQQQQHLQQQSHHHQQQQQQTQAQQAQTQQTHAQAQLAVKAQCNIILARFLDDCIGAMEFSLLRHYGTVGPATIHHHHQSVATGTGTGSTTGAIGTSSTGGNGTGSGSNNDSGSNSNNKAGTDGHHDDHRMCGTGAASALAADDQQQQQQRCGWDAADIEGIASTIARNFHELRYVASAPAWPAKRWLTMLPLHLECIRAIDANLTNVQCFGGSCPTSTAAAAAATSAGGGGSVSSPAAASSCSSGTVPVIVSSASTSGGNHGHHHGGHHHHQQHHQQHHHHHHQHQQHQQQQQHHQSGGGAAPNSSNNIVR